MDKLSKNVEIKPFCDENSRKSAAAELIQKKVGYYRSYWMRQDLQEPRFPHGGMQALYHHQVYA